MRSILLSLTAFLLSLHAIGQSGNYFMSHYSPKNEKIDNLSFDIAQDQKGVLYFANKAGVLQFDGRNWTMVETQAPIYTIAVSDAGIVYGGGLSGFGRVLVTEHGQVFQSMSMDYPHATNVFQSVTVGERVYFLSDNQLFIIYQDKVEKVIPSSSNNGSFKGIFDLEGDVYVSTGKDEILKLTNQQLVRSQMNPSAGSVLFTHALPGSKKTLLGTSADRIFLFEGGSLQELSMKDSEYLDNNVLVSGAWVNETLIALGTLRGGVLFVNPTNGETQEIANYYTGLPDNEVFAMLSDQQHCIWVAHDYGYTRIAPLLPFRTFNHYPGLEGNLLCAYSSGTDVYVGTTLGLYMLVRDEVYEEEEYFVVRKRKVESAEPEAEEIAEIAQSTSERARRGLFGLGKKKKEKPVVVQEEEKPKEKVKKETIVNTRERRTRKVLKSLQYKYEKVQGIRGKVTHMITAEGKLLTAGIGGVFAVEGLHSMPITHDPVRSIFLSPSLQQVFISTYNEEIKSYAKKGTEWSETHLLDTLQEYVTYMFEDKLQNLWLCARTGVLKIEMIDDVITNIEQIPYQKASIDETVGLAVGSDVYVVNAGEFHQYDAANERFVKYDSLPGTRKYFASAGSFWFHDGHRWRTIDNRVTQNMQLDWLGLFSDVRYLATEKESQGLWIITSNNELYRFTPSGSARPDAYPLFLKDIRGPESMHIQTKRLEVEEEQGALIFEFIQPDYNGFQAIEYRYMVSGISDVWSDWSPQNNIIPFPYLPSGDYEITVQSRNIFGNENELGKISFSVLPPYWRQPWFYGLEVAFFSMLVLLSIRLSVSNEKYRPISRVLSLLTVIIFIQMVQTTVYSFINMESTPVMEFLIQVFIALLVLPLEVRLRNLMERASEGKFDITKLIVRKTRP